MRKRFMQEVRTAIPSTANAHSEPVTGDELSGLPAPAQRFLRFMGVPGHVRDASFRGHWRGRFRLKPDVWLPCEIWQYNSAAPIARIFHMRVRMAGVLPVIARDTYMSGRGHLRATLLGLIDVANENGPELDAGELVTWLNDAVLLAPSMLIIPQVRFTEVDDTSFDISVFDDGNSVSARVTVDGQGRLTEFGTTDRFWKPPSNPKGPWQRCRWTTPVDGWQRIAHRQVAAGGKAVWHPPEGPYAYAEITFAPDGIDYNVAP